MEYHRPNFLFALLKVRPGLSNRDIIEQFTHFIFTGETVTTYNDEICISYPLKTHFQCSVSNKELLNTLDGITTQMIDISHDSDKQILRIASPKTHAEISTLVEQEAERLLGLLHLEDLKWEHLPDTFMEGARLCLFSTSKDMTKGIATCISVQDNLILGADGIRISKFIMKEGTGVHDVNIPARSILKLTEFPYKPNEWAISDGWVHFRAIVPKDEKKESESEEEQTVIFTIRTIDGKYPNVEPYFNFKGGKRAKLPPKLKEAIDKVLFMVEGKTDRDQRITVRMELGEISVKASKQIGWIRKSVEFQKALTEPVVFETNPHFFSQILEKLTAMRFTEDAALFSRPDYQHVIALMEEKK